MEGAEPGPNTPSFDELFENSYSELRRFVVRRVENRETAEDVLSETFAIAWRRRDVTPDPPLPWLFGICRNVIANHRRSSRRRLRLIRRLGSSSPDLGRDPADLLAERGELGRAFGELGAAQQEVLKLAAWEGLAANEAAAVLGCSPAAFRVRLHRARTELAKRLGEGGHEEGEGTSRAEGVQETT